MIKPTLKFHNWTCVLVEKQYHNGNPAWQLRDAVDHSPIATVTVNPHDELLASGEVAIKDWSENEGLYLTLLKAGIIHPSHRSIPSGFVDIPVCQRGPNADMYLQ
jgi:hypothetical protein